MCHVPCTCTLYNVDVLYVHVHVNVHVHALKMFRVSRMFLHDDNHACTL